MVSLTEITHNLFSLLFACFFSNNEEKIELLVRNFVEQGSTITDPAATQALALALAKMSQESTYMTVIEKLNLLHSALDLLFILLGIHENSLLLQESCCIAICRFSLRIDNILPADKRKIADVFFHLLESADQYVLGSTISGIRALGSSGLCPKELLSETLLSRVANIVARYEE